MVSLRNFYEEDAAVLREQGQFQLPPEDIRALIAGWNTKQFQGRYFEMFAVVEDEEIVGTLSLYELSPSVISIGPEIFPAYRRRHFAAQAMESALSMARVKGYRIVSQQVRSDNAPSLGLHEMLGFETDRYVYKNNRGNDVLIFLKSLL